MVDLLGCTSAQIAVDLGQHRGELFALLGQQLVDESERLGEIAITRGRPRGCDLK